PILGLAGFVVIMRADPRWEPGWRYVEEQKLEKEVLPKARGLEREAETIYGEQARLLLNQNWKRRDPEAVEKAIPALGEARAKLQEAVEVVARAGPFVSPDMENARNVRRELLQEEVKLFELREKCLREGAAWTPEQEEELRDQRGRVEEAAQRWQALLQ